MFSRTNAGRSERKSIGWGRRSESEERGGRVEGGREVGEGQDQPARGCSKEASAAHP